MKKWMEIKKEKIYELSASLLIAFIFVLLSLFMLSFISEKRNDPPFSMNESVSSWNISIAEANKEEVPLKIDRRP